MGKAPPVVAVLPPVIVGTEPDAAAEEPEPVIITEEDWIDVPVCAPVVAAVEPVLDPVAEPVFAEPVLDAVSAVFDACTSLSDLAAEERLGTAPELESAEMGAARSVATARATRCDRDNFIVNVCVCILPSYYGMSLRMPSILCRVVHPFPNNRTIVVTCRMKVEVKFELKVCDDLTTDETRSKPVVFVPKTRFVVVQGVLPGFQEGRSYINSPPN